MNFEVTIKKLKNPDRAICVGTCFAVQFGKLSKEEARDKLGYNGKYRHVLLSCGGEHGRSARERGSAALDERLVDLKTRR